MIYQMTCPSKICTSCGVAKSLDDFYSHPTGTRTCKECKRSYAIRYRENLRDSSPEVLKEYHTKYINKFPLKRKAHVILGNAVRDGRIAKSSCEICGNPNVHGHHDDYSFPLAVRWLCPIHHKEWHTINGEAKNSA
jgi:transposase-like protein